MKNYLRSTAAAVVLLGCAGTANAGQLYMSVFGGMDWGADLDPVTGGGGIVNASRIVPVTHQNPAPHLHQLAFVFTAATSFNMSGAEADSGFVFGASVGREYDDIIPGLRLEFEGTYRRNSFGPATLQSGGTDTSTASSAFAVGGNITHPADIRPLAPLTVVNATTAFAPAAGTYAFAADFTTGMTLTEEGNVTTWALMANAWIDLGNSSTFTPYVGGGVGYAISKFDGGAMYSGVDGSFAWQLGAGVNVAVSDETSIGLGYRYFDAGDVELSLATVSGTAAATEQDVRGSSLLLNLTHKFN